MQQESAISSVIVPYIFRHCDLLDLNKIHKKKLQVENKSFTDCHTEGLMMIMEADHM